MRTADAMFRRWQTLAGDASGRAWGRDQMAGFFQRFLPHGERLAQAFVGVTGAEDVLPRLLEVYQATADGWLSAGGRDAYFIVRNPRPILWSTALELTRSHLGMMATVAA